MPEVREDELAPRAVAKLDRLARLGVDQLDVDEPAGAEVHAVLLLALAEERRPDVADAHRLGDPRAPTLLELGAERGLAAAGLARDEDPPDARGLQVGELEEVRRVGRPEHDGAGPEG